MTSVLDVVNHYQRSIEKSSNNEERLLHCITKLYNLPVTVEHLQDTGIGKTVNSLRKFDGEVGVTAKALVTKWKAMVAAAESSENDEDDEEDNGKSEDDDDPDEIISPSKITSSPRPLIQVKLKERSSKSSHHTKDDDREKRSDHRREKDHSKSDHNNDREKDKQHYKEKDKKKSSHSSHSQSQSTNKTHHSKTSPNTTSNQQNKSFPSPSSSKHNKKQTETASISHEDSENEHDNLIMNIDIKPDLQPNPMKNKDGEKTSNNSIHKHRNSSSNKSKDEIKEKNERKNEKSRDSGHKKSKDRSKNISSKSTSSSSLCKHQRKEKIKSESEEDNKKIKTSYPGDSSSSYKTEKSSSSKNGEISNSSEYKAGEKTDSKLTATPTEEPQKAKKRKVETDDDELENDGIDHTTGASFADALGWLENPKKSKSKKKSLTSPQPSTSSSSPGPSKMTSSKKSRPSASSTTAKSSYSYTSTSSTNPLAPPSLLASTFKLKPLEPDLTFDLPTISTNYKPMPLNPVVMDCVFSQHSNKPLKKIMTDEEAFGASISSKTMRTKVYSGAKSNAILPVPTLLELCTRILQKNIDALEYTGGVPFDILKPVLERASPEQLFNFEHFNQYVMEDTDNLWQGHCSRKFKGKKRIENEAWREMYIRCLDEQEARLTHLTENIKQSQTACVPVKQTKLAYIDGSVKAPRNVQRKQEQFGTSRKLIATPAARVASLSSVSNNIAKIGDTRLRVAAGVRDTAQVHSNHKPRRPPLMAKAMQLFKGRKFK